MSFYYPFLNEECILSYSGVCHITEINNIRPITPKVKIQLLATSSFHNTIHFLTEMYVMREMQFVIQAKCAILSLIVRQPDNIYYRHYMGEMQ